MDDEHDHLCFFSSSACLCGVIDEWKTLWWWQASEEQKGVLGDLLVAVSKIVAQEKLEGYRVVINDGESAGQSVFHLHLHILSGRPLQWPPG